MEAAVMTDGTVLRPRSAPASVPLLDLGRGNRPLKDEFLAAIGRVIDSGRFLHGPEVGQLEQQVAQLCGTEHAVGCATGSDALLLALMALEVGEGDEVIVPSFTFFATASAVWRLNARPVFVDIDPVTFNLDPQAVEEAITPATKAIIPVHLFGQCADMDAIGDIAQRHGLWLIEDAAQSIGARHRGRPAGSIGTVGCISFYPTKNLGGFGDGGMLTTNDGPLAERLRLLASHGMSPRYYHQAVGIASRLDTIQAAVLLVKLAHLGAWTKARAAHAANYDRLLTSRGLDLLAGLPRTASGCDHVWNQYTIRIPGGRRDGVKSQLAQQQIGSEVYYPVPLHLQQCFRSLGYGPGTLPHTERAAHEVLSLPVFPELTEAEQQVVVDCLSELLLARASKAA
jgi:dTDP-4-amino-4,6-dideoxygalactose transaminase